MYRFGKAKRWEGRWQDNSYDKESYTCPVYYVLDDKDNLIAPVS